VPADIVVTVPARPQFVGVLRSVVAGVGARLDYGYDVIEDLRLAVDEACAQLLSIGAPAKHLSLRVRPGAAGVEVVASIDADAGPWPPDRVEDSLGWQVLRALADDAVFERDGGRPALRFRKRAGS
jgi:serine/threonine-protein kinase RsbW